MHIVNCAGRLGGHSVMRIHRLCLFGLLLLLGASGCDQVEEDQGAAVGAADGGEADGSEASGSGSGEAGTGRSGAGGASPRGGSGEASGGRSAAGTGGASAGAGVSGGAGRAGRGGSAAGAGGADAGAGGSEAGAGAAAGAGSGGAQAGTGSSAAGSGGDRRCGTRGGVQCGADQFCNLEPDVDCGATDRGGVCETKPLVCTAIYAPVCGCDNRTHSSDCNAHGAGVSIKREGMCNPDECKAAGGRAVYSTGANIPECAADEMSWSVSGGIEPVICCLGKGSVAGRTCGGFAALMCDSGQFCNYEESAGGQGCDGMIADAAGVCATSPTACTREYRPVCSCDRRSFGNACEAHAAGASVMHEGACRENDCKAIGGRVAYGLGPAPMCNAGETEHTYVVGDDGSMPIEGAICCLP
jgi:hypothetical protein